MDAESRKLELIYKYFPHLKGIEETAPILKNMGLSPINLKDIYVSGHTDLYFKIIDPRNSKVRTYTENWRFISIDLKEEKGQDSIYVNGVPYMEFFRLLDEQEANAMARIKAPDPKKESFFLDYFLYKRAIEECDPEVRSAVEAKMAEISQESKTKKK